MTRRLLGIYIHIPFCASKCGYCDFYSLAGCDYLMPDYHEALLAHLEESAESIRNYEVDTIYFGGGTPSYYGADRIAEVLDVLKQNGNVRTDAEITVECNPDSVSWRALKLMKSEGVNRLSLGLQATDDNLLRMIGRRHTYRQAVDAIEDAREIGFDNISIDLMYGLPTQTKQDWAETLAKAVGLHVEHISVYGLKLEPGTPMYREYYGSPVLPDDDEQADMYSYAAQMLNRYGYHQYEISNFCAPGFLSRHNLKYWELDDYMGFGPGAHSCIGHLRYSYIKDLKGYITGVERGTSLVDEYNNLDAMERAAEYLMLGMRTARGISERDYRTLCQSDWRPIEKTLKIFQEKGWTVANGDRWHFTVPGYLVSNQLISILMEVQASGRIENTPWLSELFDAEDRTEMPPSEEELFRELYRQTTQTE